MDSEDRINDAIRDFDVLAYFEAWGCGYHAAKQAWNIPDKPLADQLRWLWGEIKQLRTRDAVYPEYDDKSLYGGTEIWDHRERLGLLAHELAAMVKAACPDIDTHPLTRFVASTEKFAAGLDVDDVGIIELIASVAASQRVATVDHRLVELVQQGRSWEAIAKALRREFDEDKTGKAWKQRFLRVCPPKTR